MPRLWVCLEELVRQNRLSITPRGPIAKGTLRTTLVLLLRLGMQAGTLLVLARLLGPAVFGLYAAVGALAVLLGTLATLGTHLALLRTAHGGALAREAAMRTALGTTSVGGSALLATYAGLCFFLLPSAGLVDFTTILCIGVAELLLQPLLVVAATERQARGEIARSQLVLTAPLMFRFAMAVFASVWQPLHPLQFFAAGYALSVAVTVVLLAASNPVAWPKPSNWRVAGWTRLKNASGYALQGASSSGVSEIDKLLAGKLLAGDAVGVYSAASRVANAAILPVVAMAIAATPKLFSAAPAQRQRLYPVLFGISALYGTTASLGLICVAPWLEPVFGQAYSGLFVLVHTLAWALPAVCVRNVATTILSATERAWSRVALELCGMCTIILLVLAQVEKNGAQGLSLAVVWTEWLLMLAALVLVWRASDKVSRGAD